MSWIISRITIAKETGTMVKYQVKKKGIHSRHPRILTALYLECLARVAGVNSTHCKTSNM